MNVVFESLHILFLLFSQFLCEVFLNIVLSPLLPSIMFLYALSFPPPNLSSTIFLFTCLLHNLDLCLCFLLSVPQLLSFSFQTPDCFLSSQDSSLSHSLLPHILLLPFSLQLIFYLSVIFFKTHRSVHSVI